MRILLDTHVLLWSVAQSDRLPVAARELLEDMNNSLYVSVASLWEIAIKTTLGRHDFVVDLHKLRQTLSRMGIVELPIEGTHAEALMQLPPFHKDPFDRMLVAQSMAEPLVLLTNDTVLAEYWDGVKLV